MLTVTTWLWGTKYSLKDVLKLAFGVQRNLRQEHKFICINDQFAVVATGGTKTVPLDIVPIPQEDRYLLAEKGCFARLRMFDPLFQSAIGLAHGDRLVCIDLDVVVTGPLDDLFDRPEPYLILKGANAANPCPFNASVTMLRAGEYPEVWSHFSLDVAKTIPFFEFPDDQGWIWHKLPQADGWQVGQPSGIYAFQKPGWPSGNDLPGDARIVVFPGWRSPNKFSDLPWIKEHWRVPV